MRSNNSDNMGKGGRKAQARHGGQKDGGGTAGPRKMQSYPKLSTKTKQKNQNQDKQQQQKKKQRNNQPTIPFKPSDRILLIGEGGWLVFP